MIFKAINNITSSNILILILLIFKAYLYIYSIDLLIITII